MTVIGRPMLFMGHGSHNLNCGYVSILKGLGLMAKDSPMRCSCSWQFADPWSAEVADSYLGKHCHDRLTEDEALAVALFALFSTASMVLTGEGEILRLVRDCLTLLPLRLYFADESDAEKKIIALASGVAKVQRLDQSIRQFSYAASPIEHPAFLLSQLESGKLGFPPMGGMYRLVQSCICLLYLCVAIDRAVFDVNGCLCCPFGK